MAYEDFDLDIKQHIKKLARYANRKFPKRRWLIEVCFWDDGDYRISLQSSWGNYRDCFEYQKSIDEYQYHKEQILNVVKGAKLPIKKE